MPGTSTFEWHFGQSMREPAIDEGALSLALHCGQLIRIGSWEGWLTEVTQSGNARGKYVSTILSKQTA